MSLESYREIASDAVDKAYKVARMAADSAYQANVLGPTSIGYTLASNEAHIAAICAEMAHTAMENVYSTTDVEIAAKWTNVAQYAVNKTEAAAGDARLFAADPALYQ